jgi:hypothetical protein
VPMNQDDIFCVICTKAIDLNKFKRHEHGLAVHDRCYVLKMQSFSPRTTAPAQVIEATPTALKARNLPADPARDEY